MEYSFTEAQLDQIEEVLKKDFIELGINSAVLIDMAGNIIAEFDNSEGRRDIYSLAALAAGNFGAVSAMAKMIGEDEFSLLFHKGENESMHFSKIMKDFLLITIFGHETALGLVRLKASDAANKIEKVLQSSVPK